MPESGPEKLNPDLQPWAYGDVRLTPEEKKKAEEKGPEALKELQKRVNRAAVNIQAENLAKPLEEKQKKEKSN